MRQEAVNAVYLPGIRLPASVKPTAALDEALCGAELVCPRCHPRHARRDATGGSADHAERGRGQHTKGLESRNLLRISRSFAELEPSQSVAVLSGPSFRAKLARELPTAVCVASLGQTIAADVQAKFGSRYFRLYATTDVGRGGVRRAVGIIAIAAGGRRGWELGQNALAALYPRSGRDYPARLRARRAARALAGSAVWAIWC